MLQIFLALVLFAQHVSSTTIDITDKIATTYTVDINDVASVYLKELCDNYKETAVASLDKMLEGIIIGKESAVREASKKYWDDGNVPEPFHSEIVYISQCLGKDIIDIVAANLIYEFTAYCTSIVTVDHTGRILHGRNQDFPIILRDNTVNIKYVDGNEELFETTTFFGFVGAPTAVKKGAFSLSMDARFVDPITWQINFDSIANGAGLRFPSSWLLRECLLRDDSYDECLKRLEQTSVMAPIYYIIGGTDESNNGAIVTRTPDGLQYETTKLGSGSDGSWYLVETNFDNDLEVVTDLFDQRKQTAVNELNKIGQNNIDEQMLYQVLSTKPTLAQDTVYTTIMSASSGNYQTTIRYTADLHLSPIDGYCAKHEECRGYGLLKTDIACCNNKCERKQIDYAGLGWCPYLCKHAFGCPAGSCIVTQKEEGESCQCHENCEGYGLGSTDMACCDGICKRKVVAAAFWNPFGECPVSAQA